MESSQEQQTEKTTRISDSPKVDEASREDLVKQVKRQLAILQKAKAKCDDLNRKCQEKDKAIEELRSRSEAWEQDQAELKELRLAYQSLQEAQEKQFHSFQVLEEQLATSNEDLVRWRHRYQECLEKLQCTESKMTALTQGTECLQQELHCLEAENRVANSKVEELSQSQKQLQAERAVLQQQLDALEQDKAQEAAGSETTLEMSQSHMKQKIEELLSQCSALMQERDMCNSAREALVQQAESANEEAANLRQKISVLLEERSSLENQRDEKMNECNLLQEEKHGLERQVSDLYQTKEDLEAKEKEFAKILDDNSSLEKLLAEAMNENTQLQESVNSLQVKLVETEAEKQRLADELETARNLAFSESQRLEDVIRNLEDKLANQIEKHQNVEHELEVSLCQQIESEKLIENLKAAFLPCQLQECPVDIDCTPTKTSELLGTQVALKKQEQVTEQEKKSAVINVRSLEEALRKMQTEKADLEEELASIKNTDRQLFEELQTSINKVSLLEKELDHSFHEKQNIVDELCQVKDLQSFLEDEATELQQECEKLKAQAGRLEADLDNDRLHIQKLEHELEAAECRDQQSLREVEMLRLQLKDMALHALKYQEAFRDCTPGNMEPHVLLKAFNRICQLILEAAERNLVDIQVEGLLPGVGATLVLNDCSDDCGAGGENPGEDSAGAVSAEAYERLKRETERVQEQLHANMRAVDLLQFEKQAIEEELMLEKSRKDCLNKELNASAHQVCLLEEKVADLESQFQAQVSGLKNDLEQKRKELKEKDRFLADTLGRVITIRKDYEDLEGIKQEHARVLDELCVCDSSRQIISKAQENFNSLLQQYMELRGHWNKLEINLKRANQITPPDREAPNPAISSEHLETEGVGTGEVITAPVLGERGWEDVEIKRCCTDLRSGVEGTRDVDRHSSEDCSSLRAHLLTSTETQECICEEASKLKAELQAKSKLLDRIHGELDDQLEQSEKLEALLMDRNRYLQECKSDVVKKDSELAGLTLELSHLKDQLIFYEKECARLCAVFQPESNNEAGMQHDMLREWYSAHRTMLKLLSQLIVHASRQQHPQVFSDGNGDSDVLSQARCMHAALSGKLESVSFKEEPSSSLYCIITRAVCKDLATELALIKSFEQMLGTISVGEPSSKTCPVEPEAESEVEVQRRDKEIAYLQSSVQEKEDKLTKYKALIIKLKKEVADKSKQVNFMERELSDMKQELEKNAQASKQSVQNFQSLQNEYDNLQDRNEATRSLCKELEVKVASAVNELAEAKCALADASTEKNKLKQINEVLTAEVKAWEHCKVELEGKLTSAESQASSAKEQEEKLLCHIKVLEEQLSEANKQMLAEKEQLARTAMQLEKVQKETKMHTLLNLEIADYERTVAELNNLLKEKNDELDNTRKESLAYQSKITNLVEHIGFLENQKKADDERVLAYKETVANLKEELSKSRKYEEELREAEVRLESEVKAAQLREEELKLSCAAASRKCLVLDSALRSAQERNRHVVRTLDSEVESLKEELSSAKAELETTKVEFENYKVRVHSVLKQQKENTAGTYRKELSDTQEKFQATIKQMNEQLNELKAQLVVSQAEAKASQDEYDRVAQQHQSVVLELDKRDHQWKCRLEEVMRQNSAEMESELERQLQQQYEDLSNKCQKKLAAQEAEHKRALESHLETIEDLKQEIAEMQQKLPRQSSPFEDAPAIIDITTLERQQGEGSESISPVPPIAAKSLPWNLVPAGDIKPFAQLLGEGDTNIGDVESLHAKVSESQKEVDHLAELLNESESSNLRLTEQVRVLKEEIRRLERNQEREKHAQNLEYLKNIIMKFVTLRGGSEKERLVPVLTTMLKLSPEEKKDLEAVVTGETQQDAAGASGWGGYLPRWTGFVG
ncbi:GRIP and coiled-coil domain-containing protein 2-like isoform X2 [Dermacentor albipictus]|uniref:GRIP and coiled-coil domain-containing protein 2-like isoform X2 n=1 Tax=Dermacentor albipictus TaxID=60249 RepID=UPI0038FCA353